MVTTMRLVSFGGVDRFAHAGVLIGDCVIDLAAAAPLVYENAAGLRWSMRDILAGLPDGDGLDGVAQIVAAVLDYAGVDDADMPPQDDGVTIGGVELLVPRSRVRLLAPVPHPASLRDGYLFEQHVATTMAQHGRGVPDAWYEAPTFYFGNHQAILGPEDDLPLPRTAALDYELEVACVIGRAGRDIAEDDAWGYVAGLMIMNDWSARDVQRREMRVGLGPAKAKDFATSLGPWLVTLDDLEPYRLPDDRYDLTMVARVNGEERSRGNLRAVYHPFAALIAHASRDALLVPGDVIGSGTVGGGCLLELTGGAGPWLAAGDMVELDVTGLGVLRTRIREP
jgi:fumarylacetoacetate (FAA) hydrolase